MWLKTPRKVKLAFDLAFCIILWPWSNNNLCRLDIWIPDWFLKSCSHLKQFWTIPLYNKLQFSIDLNSWHHMCLIKKLNCPIIDISPQTTLLMFSSFQGFLSTYKGRQLGTIGHFGCFSFHYTKNVICGEGGAISINRSALEAPAKRALVLWEKGTNRCTTCSAVRDVKILYFLKW